MKKKNILFVNDEMVMGGVARILCTLLKLIDKNKYNIDVLILHKHGELLSEIPEDVNVLEGTDFFNTIDIPFIECDITNILSKFRLLFYMKTGLIKNKISKERSKMLHKQYDIEFSAKEGFCTIFNAFGDSKKKVNWIQTDYKENNYASNHMKLVKDALKKIDMNIACSDQVNTSFKEVFNIDNVITIHNPIDVERIKILSNESTDIIFDSNKINLITVARFHQQKGLERLIKAFAKYKDYYSLIIIGDGELKSELFSLSKILGVYETIIWTGILSNPYSLIKQSDLFVMTSYYEGYPTITIESLISGTPILTTEVAGVKEQIINPDYGYIINNDDNNIVQAFDKLKNSKKELLQKKKKLSEYQYENSIIINKMDRIFNE